MFHTRVAIKCTNFLFSRYAFLVIESVILSSFTIICLKNMFSPMAQLMRYILWVWGLTILFYSVCNRSLLCT